MPRFTFLICLLLSTAVGADRAEVSGLIQDSSGGALANVSVVAMNEETGVRYRAHTSAEGTYRLPRLVPGSYKITASKPGFRTSARLHIEVAAAASTPVDFVLPLAGIRQGLTVESRTSPADISASAEGTIIGGDRAERLPLNGRGLLGFVDLAPGTVATPASSGEAGQFSVNGQRPNANYFVIDGINSNGGIAGGGPAQFAGGALPGMTAFGGTQSMVSLSALAEVRVDTTAFAPEFGRMPGAQVTLTTRSGSEEFHGSASYAFRNEKLDANDWIANSAGLGRSPARLNHWGAALGGPVWPGRTYFFSSYEGLDLVHSATARLLTPSEQSRRSAPPLLNGLLNAFPRRGDVSETAPVIPYTARPTRQASLNSGGVRLDHALTPNISLFARYQQSPSWSESGFLQTEHSDFGSHRITLGATAVLAGGITSDLRFSYSGSGARTAWRGNASPPPNQILIPQAENNLYALAIGGLGEIIIGESGRHRQGQLGLREVVALNRDRHEFRFGLEYDRLTPQRLSATASVADYYPSLSDALAGHAPTTTQSLADPASGVITTWSLFAQDTWRVSQRLALVYGTRWELTPAPALQLAGYPTFASLGQFPGTMPIATGEAASNFLFSPGVAQISPPSLTGAWPTRYTQFAPRVGLAYRVAPRSVLRASWGVFYHAGFSAATDVINGFPFNRWQISAGGLSSRTFSSLQGYRFADDLKLPRSNHWNLSWEITPSASSTASISYVGSSGRNLLRREGSLAPVTLVSINKLASEIVATNHGASSYHGLQMQYRLRMKEGLQASFGYTWSHSIDNGSWDSGVSLVDPDRGITTQRDRGSSSFDVRHAFQAAFTNDLGAIPFGRHWQRTTKGWTLQSLARSRTGFPMTVRAGENWLGLGFDNMTRPDWNSSLPIWIADPLSPGGCRINPEAFSLPPDGRQGNLGRNTIRGFGMWSMDLSLARSFAVSSRGRLVFRAEAFNAFNHPGFADPVSFLENARFGQSPSMLNLMLGTGTPRSGLTPAFQIGGPRTLQAVIQWHF